jgi:arsenate reductase-like glutaredoxin family protein
MYWRPSCSTCRDAWRFAQEGRRRPLLAIGDELVVGFDRAAYRRHFGDA